MSDKGHIKDNRVAKASDTQGSLDSFVLEKQIFSNVFEKDIQRVYIYKKSERLAKAVHLIAPAFRSSPALATRLDTVAVALIDAAILPPTAARDLLARELLALSSLLSIARSGGYLSPMNADLIAREAQQLLSEIAGYEEPRVFLDEAPTLASMFKTAVHAAREEGSSKERPVPATSKVGVKDNKGRVKDTAPVSVTSRRDAIVEVLRSRGPSYIKDISTVIRDVSEKTIQRELAALVSVGLVDKQGDRRWTTYTLVG